MKLLLVAKDLGPSKALEKVAKYATAQGHSVQAVLGDDADILAENPTAAFVIVGWADRILVGMSSTMEGSEAERMVRDMALRSGTPVGIFVDAIGGHARQHFQTHAEKIDYLFLPSFVEQVQAAQLFTSACIVACGNPAWEDMVDMPLSRADAREELGFGDPAQKLIYCPGNKVRPDDSINSNVLFVTETQKAFTADQDVHIMFAAHPRDSVPDEYYREQLGFFATVLGREEETKRLHTLCATDMVVSACSPSTDLRARLLGIPVVNMVNEQICARMVEEFGAEVPPMAQKELVHFVDLRSPRKSTQVLRAVLLGSSLPLETPPMLASLPDVSHGQAALCIVETLCS